MQKALSLSFGEILRPGPICGGDELDEQGTITQVAAPEGAYTYNALK